MPHAHLPPLFLAPFAASALFLLPALAAPLIAVSNIY